MKQLQKVEQMCNENTGRRKREKNGINIQLNNDWEFPSN